MTTGTTITAGQTDHNDEYRVLLYRLRTRFAALVAAERAVFTTDAVGLYGAYLGALPAEQQYHTCNTCKRFIEAFGGLVTIAPDGSTTSLMWDSEVAPEFYAPAVQAMERIVARARVSGVFITNKASWGQAVTGPWTHFAVEAPSHLLYTSRVKEAHERAAELREDYKTVQTALAEFNADTVAQALTLLRSEQLYRAEKVIGPAEWLAALHQGRAATKNKRDRDNLVWLAVATAPPGFAHPRSSMVGTLLEDIAGGMDFAQVSKRFAGKMRPDIYQRPQAAPAAGNIAQAEKLIETLGLEPALHRRYARLDEIQTLWRSTTPRMQTPAPGGVFSHLTPKSAAPAAQGQQITIPLITMTWEKFARTALPDASRIDVRAPTGHAAFTAMVTAVHPDAPPILQWDREEQRNPVSWYLWTNGSPAETWGLVGGAYHALSAISAHPSQWFGNQMNHQGDGVILVIEGAKDSSHARAGAALFPEILKSELHQVRATIEAYSRNATMEGVEEASACGLFIKRGQDIDVLLRVTSRSGVQEYRIDRWD